MNMSPETNSNHCTKQWIAGIVLFWFFFALFSSVLGLFDSNSRPPIALGGAVLLPIIAFVASYFAWSGFRTLVLRANLKLLTLAQTFRVAGIVFIILFYQRLLPGTFALSAGWGDIAVGATAPLVAWVISSRTVLPKKTFVFWSVLGMLDLVAAVTLGILSSASPLGILAGEVTTELMGRFPLSLIPTFFVPLFLILHLVSLIRLARGPVESGSEDRLKSGLQTGTLLSSQPSTANQT